MNSAEAGTDDRLEELFQRLYPQLLGLTYQVLDDRGEAEDVLQEVFWKLADDPVLARPDAEVSAWLRRASLNRSFNRLRGRRRARERLDRVGRLEPGDAGESSAGPLVAVLRREEADGVRRALARLPDRQRNCLLLRHSGYSYAEIAATLQIAVGSVGVLLARGEAAFRLLYEERSR